MNAERSMPGVCSGRPSTRDAGMQLVAPLVGHTWHLRGATILMHETGCSASVWARVECEVGERIVVAKATIAGSLGELTPGERVPFDVPLRLSHPAIGKPTRCEITTNMFYEVASYPIDEHCSEAGVTRPGPCPSLVASRDPDPAWIEALAFAPSEGDDVNGITVLALARDDGVHWFFDGRPTITDSRDGVRRPMRDGRAISPPGGVGGADTFVLEARVQPSSGVPFELTIRMDERERDERQVFCFDDGVFSRGSCSTAEELRAGDADHVAESH